jgi:hypothetical protein
MAGWGIPFTSHGGFSWESHHTKWGVPTMKLAVEAMTHEKQMIHHFLACAKCFRNYPLVLSK